MKLLLTLCTEGKSHRKRQISLSDSTAKRTFDRISEDLRNQLLDKLKRAHSYGIQLNKTTDISDKVQLIVYCRLANEEAKTIVEHYLCCLKIGVSATAQAIFDKLNQLFEEHGLDWTKCTSIITDGTTAIQGFTKGVIRKIKNVSPCVLNHCMIHQEPLVLKKLKHRTNRHCDFATAVDNVIGIANFVRIHSKDIECLQNCAKI